MLSWSRHPEIHKIPNEGCPKESLSLCLENVVATIKFEANYSHPDTSSNTCDEFFSYELLSTPNKEHIVAFGTCSCYATKEWTCLWCDNYQAIINLSSKLPKVQAGLWENMYMISAFLC